MTRSLGELIRHRRKELGLTQDQLAERVGRSQVAVSEWERNVVRPSDFKRLAEALDVPVERLVLANASDVFFDDDPFEGAILQAERLSHEHRNVMLTIYRALVAQNGR
jgi:transcriptional regulator with XRE-family HTH domain